MKNVVLWIIIGLISGVVLAAFMKIPQLIWGLDAYNLLFEVSYIPFVDGLRPVWLIQGLFHFTTCILSLFILYKILKIFNLESSLMTYILVIGIGSGLLYFLTLLSDNTPPINDYVSWIIWAVGHVFFSMVGCFLIQKWIVKR